MSIVKTRDLIGTKFIIEQTPLQTFNTDTILLADFIKIPAKAKQVLDFGTGHGALLLYCALKTKAKITGLEIQEIRYQQAKKNIRLNNLEERISVMNINIKEAEKHFKDVDVIISNPPFFKVDETSNVSSQLESRIERHEILIDLEGIIKSASDVLKQGGKLFLIHRPQRLAEIVILLLKYDFAIKRVRFAYPYIHKKPNHVMIEAAYRAQQGLEIEAPLVLYEGNHIYTKELLRIYGGKNVT